MLNKLALKALCSWSEKNKSKAFAPPSFPNVDPLLHVIFHLRRGSKGAFQRSRYL